MTKRIMSFLLVILMLFSTFCIVANAEGEVIMIAPTVKLENGTAQTIRERVYRSTDFKNEIIDKPTKVAGIDGNAELVSNGSFEYLSGEKLATWGAVQGILYGALGEKAFRDEDAKDGKYSLHFKNDVRTWVLQAVDTFIPGETYEFSVWCKRNIEGTSAAVYFMTYYKDPEDGMMVEYRNGRIGFDFNDAPIGQWTQKTMRFTVPEDCVRITPMINMMGAGDLQYDGISMVGLKKQEDTSRNMAEYLPVPEGAVNLFTDPSVENNEFEELPHQSEKEGVWYTRKGKYDGIYSRSTDVARTGQYSLHAQGVGEMIWFGQPVKIEPNKRYQVAAWVYVKEGSEYTISFQCDAFRGVEHTEANYIKDGQRTMWAHVPLEPNKWHRIQGQFNTYPGTTHYTIMFRGGSSYYDMYIDDFEMYELGDVEAKMIRRFEPDEVFYYADRKGEGSAKLLTAIDKYPDIAKYPVRFRFYDGEKIVKEEMATLDANGEAVFRYDLDLLAEKKKEYKIEAALLDAAGNPVVTPYERLIYKYDRPTMLDETQRFLDSGGQVVNYILAQGSVEEVMWRCPDANLTVGRLIGSGRTSINEKIDIAEQAGMKFTITLFNHNYFDTNPGLYEQVKEAILKYKDEPNLLAWYLWEEPPFQGDDIRLDETLRIGAKLIRDLDPNHPIGSVISDQNFYERFSTYNDYMDLDCYPSQIVDGTKPQYIANNVKRAMEVTDWQKPISIMNQAFLWFNYKPTWDELRNFTYQSFFEGAAGFSYHSFGKTENGGDVGCVVLDDEIWEEMEKAGWEYDFMFDHFVNMKYPMFNQNWDENVRWRTVVVDGTIYAIVLSMWEDRTTDIEIPLSDYTGNVKFSGARAELLAGENAPKSVAISGDSFKVSVKPMAAYLYKITPNEAVDFSSVPLTRFRDLSRHMWAREAIIALDEKGIVNGRSAVAFGPGQDITRGDFAMFLVRTLGLTSDATENFADVKADREYTKELAIGKSLGILNGVGDNKFNPDATITRQDMMTMIGRGMKLSGEADLSAFSDNAAVADYALPHVKAMIASGLVKGNADGTINPRGNTTRAEAAVIMQRILNQ